MGRIAKILGAALLLPVLLFLIFFVAVSIFDSPVYTWRLLRYGQSDIEDYRIFPERPVDNGDRVSVLAPGEGTLPQTVSWLAPNGERRTAPLQDVIHQSGTRAFIVVRDDRIIYEDYFNGATRDSIHTSFSSAKSFNSALIGAAIARGDIGSVDDTLIQYVPELAGRGLDALTIRDLLLMSSGIRYVEYGQGPIYRQPFGDDALTYYAPDLRRVALSAEAGGATAGASWHYNNYHPLLEGLILERATGMPVATFLQESIWQPMGAEFPASWSLDSKSSGFEKMESGINARAIDYARFGLLFLHQGQWNDRQILPASWVEASTSPAGSWDVPDSNPHVDVYYKYHWWGVRNEDGTHEYSAVGRYWQMVYVAPHKNMVIVRLGDDPASYPVPWLELLHDLVQQMEQTAP